MADFLNKKYKLASSEKFDEYMQALGKILTKLTGKSDRSTSIDLLRRRPEGKACELEYKFGS